MRYRGEIKLTKDEYAGFYSCGLTMVGSCTMQRFSEEVSEEKITYQSKDGLHMEVITNYDSQADATEVLTSFSNDSDEEVTLEMITSVILEGIKADKIHRILSFWSAEGKHKVDRINDLDMEMAWNKMAYRIFKFGNVGSMPVRRYFPFVALEDSETGTFTAVMLYTPSSWQIEVICRHDDSLTICAGLADRDFGHWTKKVACKENFIAPKAIVATGNSLEDACHKLLMIQKPRISPVDDRMGITFNEYCATWGNPNDTNMRQVCDQIAGKDIQYLVMDSGWYGKDDGYWWDYLGNWNINRNRFPQGLKPIASYIRSKGMIPGIWFEFESVAHGSELYECGQHLVMRDGVPLTIGGRRFLDMEDPWVIDFLKTNVIDLLKEAGFGYIKIDYNDTLGIGCDGIDGLGENLRRKICATQKFFELLREQIPDLVIENCSSGGHRLEPSMMELSSMASFSDAHEILSIPLIAANLHRVIKPSQNQIWAVFRKDDTDNRIYYSLCATMLGRMGLSGDIYDLSKHQWELIEEGIEYYKRINDIIRDGKTTHIICNVDSYNKPVGGQLLLRTSGNRTLAVYHRFGESVGINDFCIANGIDPMGFGKELSRFGQSDEDFSAVVIEYSAYSDALAQ